MYGWFPLRQDMLDDYDFRKRTVTEKVLLLAMLSDINQCDAHYKADDKYGAQLDLSTDKVRRARRLFKKNGWIDYKKGCMIRGNNLATRYVSAPWALPPAKGDGIFWSAVSRYTFGILLERVWEGTFKLEDVLTYCLVAHYHWRIRAQRGSTEFRVPKRELRDLAGFQDTTGSLCRIAREFIFGNNKSLFQFEERCHFYEILDWCEPGDPKENDHSFSLARKREDRLEKRYRERRTA